MKRRIRKGNGGYPALVSHYESCLEKYGDSHLGVDWPRKNDAESRHKIMLDVIRQNTKKRAALLDFGCGASHFYEYLLRHGRRDIIYSGLDLSPKFIGLSRSKFPKNTYYCMDVLRDHRALPRFDYIVMNGVFTQKRDMSQTEMFSFFQKTVRTLFKKATQGIAFNVMSKQVDWRHRAAFHLSFDLLAAFLTRDISRNFIFRHDYGMYEYTTYVYK